MSRRNSTMANTEFLELLLLNTITFPSLIFYLRSWSSLRKKISTLTVLGFQRLRSHIFLLFLAVITWTALKPKEPTNWGCHGTCDIQCYQMSYNWPFIRFNTGNFPDRKLPASYGSIKTLLKNRQNDISVSFASICLLLGPYSTAHRGLTNIQTKYKG